MLWAQLEDACDEALFTFSGINWKEGKGPIYDNESVDERKVGEKTSHDQLDRGNSFFTFFEQLPPNTDDLNEDEYNEYEDEELDELDEEYTEALKEKEDILQCLVEEIWENPLIAINSTNTNE